VLVFGVLPALIASRGELASPLRYDSRAGTETRARRRMRQALVASQVSLGYDPNHLSLLSVAFPPSLYSDTSGKVDQNRLNALGDQLAPVYRAVPGVTGVTPMLVPPFMGSGIFVGRLDREGQTPEEMKSNPAYPMEAGGADYFRVYGIPILHDTAITE